MKKVLVCALVLLLALSLAIVGLAAGGRGRGNGNGGGQAATRAERHLENQQTCPIYGTCPNAVDGVCPGCESCPYRDDAAGAGTVRPARGNFAGCPRLGT